MTVLLLLTAIAFSYGAVAQHHFVNFDDPEYVYDNPRVTAGLTPAGIVWAFRETYSANWHPLTWVSHMLDWQLFGKNAGGHHLTNVALHAAASLCLLGALRAMTHAPWPSAFVAFAFALHPRNVESVAWVAERKDVLSAFFWAAAMWAYALYARRPGTARYLAVALLFALGLLAKPMLVTLPAALLLLAFWPLERATLAARAGTAAARTRSVRELLIEKLPLFALSLASCAITFEAQRRAGAVTTLATLPVGTRIENALVAYAAYLWSALWPTGLAAFYPYRMPLPLGEVALASAVLLSISWLALRLAARRPYVPVGWLWYLGTLVPVIGLVRVGEQAMADRFTYIPLIGVFIALAFGAADVAREVPAVRRVLWPAAIALLVAWSLATRAQVAVWRDSIALFEHALAVTDNNYMAETNLSVALLESGRVKLAIEHAGQAVRIRPGDVRAQVNLGAALARDGQMDAAEAAYRRALEMDSAYAMAHLDLAVLLADRQRWEEARREYEQVLRIDPAHAKAHAGLGWVLTQQGQKEAAIAQFRTAIATAPHLTAASNSLALALDDVGRGDEAIAVWSEALRLDPDENRMRYNLAAALAAHGRLDQAEAQYREIVRRSPAAVDARVGLADALARQGRTAEASLELRTAVADARATGNSALAGELAARLAALEPPGAPATP